MNKTRNRTRITSARLAAVIVSLTFFGHGVCAQTPSPSPWPEKPPFKPAIDAFTTALTRASWDKGFRDQLMLSCDSAKTTIAKMANMKIPDNVIIIFYEPEVIPPPSPAPAGSAASKAMGVSDSRQNEHVHVFVLPPFNEKDKTMEYKYRDYLMCCYEYWRS